MTNSIKIIKNRKLNKIMFFKNGKQIFPVSWSGNIYEFENGDIVTA